jgi:hypothetical protein
MTTPSQPTPPRLTNQNQGQVVAVIALVVVLAVIIGGLYLAQATTTISTARDIELLDGERARIQRDNERLRAEIARAQRLDNLHTRAASLGFVEAGPDDIQYIVVDGYTYNQIAPTPTLVEFTPTPETYEENFAGWLKRQFDNLRQQFSDWAN